VRIIVPDLFQQDAPMVDRGTFLGRENVEGQALRFPVAVATSHSPRREPVGLDEFAGLWNINHISHGCGEEALTPQCGFAQGL
jgi:hypothetical protein